MIMNIRPSSMHQQSVQQNASRIHWRRQLIGAAALLLIVAADSASAQGPVRRLGDRIRERALGPVPLPPRPGVLPASPLGAEAPPTAAGPLRFRLNRQPIAEPNSSQTPPRSPANPATTPNQSAQQPSMSRSANFSRAGRAGQDGRASGTTNGTSVVTATEQKGARAAWQPRQRELGAETPTPATRSQPNLSAINPPKARLGIVVDTPPEITPVGLPPRRPRGALVVEVAPDSPADYAGIVVGDLIVAVEGRLVASVQDLMDQLENRNPGDELRFQFNRNDQLQAATVTLAGADGIAIKRPNTGPSNAAANDGAPQSVLGSFGAALGGLFSGSPASSSSNRQSSEVDRPNPSLPETLPPPAPEPIDDSENRQQATP